MNTADALGRGALVVAGVWLLLPRGANAPAGPDTPRAFRAERPAAGDGPEVDHAALERVVHGVVERMVREPDLSRETRGGLAVELILALEDEGLGTPGRRAVAAQEAIEVIAESIAPFAGEHTGSEELRQRALRQQSAVLTATLLERMTGEAPSVASFGPPPEGHESLAWSALTDIDYREGDPVPESVLARNGERVFLTGFLLDGGHAREFLLVQSMWSCCFGRPPEIHEAVVVTAADEPSDAWFEGLVRVSGVLEVGEDWDDDYLLSIYRMRGARVDEMQP